MEGFGGCFNEKGWEALAVLSEAGRAEVLAALFGREGLRWGSIATGWWSHSGTPRNILYAMEN